MAAAGIRRGCRPARAQGRAPTHPGVVLREDVLPALNLTVTEAARALGVSRQALHNILSERSAMSAGMALRVGRLCGNGPGIWLAMQQARDLWEAERDEAEAIAAVPMLRVADAA